MDYYKRAVLDDFHLKLKPNKVLVLLGARRVGKTQIIKKYLETSKETLLQLNGEDINDARLLEERSVLNYSKLLKNTTLLVIDEAQNIPNIGLILKLIVDTIDGIKVIATGSSMFDLANKLGEPLVGRKNTLYLFPLAQMEFSQFENYKQTTEKLEERLLFGGYPELTQYDSWNEKIVYLIFSIFLYSKGIIKRLCNLLIILLFQNVLPKNTSVKSGRATPQYWGKFLH